MKIREITEATEAQKSAGGVSAIPGNGPPPAAETKKKRAASKVAALVRKT